MRSLVLTNHAGASACLKEQPTLSLFIEKNKMNNEIETQINNLFSGDISSDEARNIGKYTKFFAYILHLSSLLTYLCL